MNHKWDNDQCVKCGILRGWKSMTFNIGVYHPIQRILLDTTKRERFRVYFTGEEPPTRHRPNCPGIVFTDRQMEEAIDKIKPDPNLPF